MAQKERSVTVRITADLMDGIEVMREKYGTPISEQIRRALRAWLEAQGVISKAARPRAGTRGRA
jgi:Arc/MetJ-type ribon-helix-helix transcriptional regulator